MFFYQKQVILLSLFLLFFILGGLIIISINMEKITQREEQDFVFLTTKGEGLWEVRFLGSSLEISKDAIMGRLRRVISQIEQYVVRGGASIVEKMKNRQEGLYPIK